MAYEYVASGAADEVTLRWNTEAFQRIRLRPRVLADLQDRDTRLAIFGDALSAPILLAPTAYHRLMHPDGELATARGAAAAGVPYVVSTATTTPLESIARAADGTRWFQLYPLAERDRTRDVVAAAEASGCRAICLTVDTPLLGARNREQRAAVRLPPGMIAPYFHHVTDSSNERRPFVPLTWRDVSWLQSITRLPVLLKGVLAGEDAERAVSEGVSGLVVSNHGARNLDTLPATIDALPEVARRCRAHPDSARRRCPPRYRRHQGDRPRRYRRDDRTSLSVCPRGRRRSRGGGGCPHPAAGARGGPRAGRSPVDQRHR